MQMRGRLNSDRHSVHCQQCQNGLPGLSEETEYVHIVRPAGVGMPALVRKTPQEEGSLLEENEDVQAVSSNFDVSDEVLASLTA